MEKLDRELILKQIDAVLQGLQAEVKTGNGMADREWSKKRMYNISLMSSLINRITPAGSSFKKHLEKLSNDCNLTEYHQSETMFDGLLGIVKTLRFEYERGYAESFARLVHADLYSDFMDMADQLIKSNYYLPAAVIIGSTLEENLRKLCIINDIAIFREKDDKEISLAASSLNSELRKADIYNKLVEKQITAWLDIRNSAAHGKHDEFNPQDVESMYRDVVRFLTDYPA